MNTHELSHIAESSELAELIELLIKLEKSSQKTMIKVLIAQGSIKPELEKELIKLLENNSRLEC